jgi:integrase
LALRWTDVTLTGAKPQIAVKQSLSWAKGPTDAKAVSHIGPPKTEAGDRAIPVDAAVAHLLKQWKLQAGRNPLDLVFADDEGEPIRRSTIRRDVFLPALQRAGLRHVTFHSLRHSFASALIRRGAPVTEVQHLLGHKKPSVTLDVYSHWFKGADSGAATAYSAELFSDRIDTK